MAPRQRKRFEGYQLVACFPDQPDTRSRLAALLAEELVSRDDLVGVQGPHPGSGRWDGEFWQTDRWFFKSRRGFAFEELADAQAQLDRLRKIKGELADLAPAYLALTLLADPDGSYQLWSIAPRLVTLREQLDRARDAGDEIALCRGLVAFAHCLGISLGMAREQGISLDANPANFATQGGRVRYLDDDVAFSSQALGIEDAFVARFTEYVASPETWSAYTRRFVAELRCHASPDELRGLDLPSRLRAAAIFRRSSERWAELASQELLEPVGLSPTA